MNYKQLIIFIFLILQSCSNNNSHSDVITVNLKQKLNKNIAFDELYTTFKFSTLKFKHSDYYSSQLKKYRVKDQDSLIISTFNTDFKKFNYDLYKSGFLEKNYLKKLNIDTLIEKNKPAQKQLIVGIYFKNNKQILKIDNDNNNSFSNNLTLEFDENFKNNLNNEKIIENLPLIDFSYSKKQGIRIDRKIIVYPSPNNNWPSENETINKSRLTGVFKDYWKGDFIHNGNKYDVAIVGMDNNISTIYIKPETLDFSRKNSSYNYNFKYRLNDTILINKSLFVIDSLNYEMTNLSLKPTEANPDNYYSDKVGYQLNDFELEGINNVKTRISEIQKKQKFILLDFWGTWCKPCIELTPSLKKLHNDYKENLNLISIAYDKDLKSVIEYTNKNNMDWFQAFLKRSRNKDKSKIISKLSVKKYPTFILMNSERKILYRTSGFEGFKEIVKFLEKKLK